MIDAIGKALDLAQVDYLVLDRHTMTITHVAPVLLAKWNCQRQDIVGKPLVKYGTGLVSARHIEPTEAAPSQTSIELCYEPPLGSSIKGVFSLLSADDRPDAPVVIVGAAPANGSQDIRLTNERRLNLALRSGGYALWDHDFETGKTYNSPEMLAIFSGNAASAEFLDYYSFNTLVHPDDVENTIENKIQRAPFGTDVFQTRYRVLTGQGKYSWIESLAGLLRDPATGRPSKCVGLCRNIDHEMLTLERLRNSEIMLKRTQEISRIGSFKLRLESGVSRLTAELAAMIGLADAMVHPNLNTFIKMIEPGDAEKFTEAIELAKLGKQVKNLEISVKTKSGAVEWFAVTIEPERDAKGGIDSVFGACQLVTERKRLEDKFHQAQKMEAVGHLTGGIAHDFNNLLMVVMGNLQLVESRVKDDPQALQRIRAATEAATKGSELTRRMLAFSRQQTLQNRDLVVNDLLGAMQDMLRQALTAAVDLKFIPGQGIWPVKADKTMLETAVLNLTINARDAMAGKPGSLVIETQNRKLDAAYAAGHQDVLPGDYVEIAVTDQGCGISAENIEKVFNPFFTTKGPEAGSGLGLSMIYGFVKQSGGHVKIYSEVGVGTTVKMYLPRLRTAAADEPLDQPEAVQEPEMPAETSHMPGRKAQVLVVDDNPSVREVAAAMIEDMGFETITATNGVEGLKTIEERPGIDLMLSDVIMAGGMHGPELAAKAMKLRPDLKVLFMSGYAPGSVRQMQDLPVEVELVNKPFSRSELTEKVRRALAFGKAA